MEERVIKFIWDYYGDPAVRTAAHHSEHLQEFAEGRGLRIPNPAGYEKLGEKRARAFILLQETEALALKDILRPEKAVVLPAESI